MTNDNLLRNYRLSFWEINGDFDNCIMIDHTRETKLINQKVYQPAFTPRKLITLLHSITAVCFGDTDITKRFIKIELTTVIETDFNINIEKSLNELSEIGYNKIQELINAIISNEDNLKMLNILTYKD